MHRTHAGIVHCLGGAMRRQLLQKTKPAFADHPPGCFGDSAEDTTNTAGLVTNGTIRKGEITLFRVAAPFEREKLIFRPRCAPVLDDAVEHRPDDVPDLRPHVAPRPTECCRMLFDKKLAVGVVIELDVFGSPPDQNGKARVETGTNSRSE